ncbi:MAG: hypothetical protein U0703_22750 [Anaerolineae bacterium]
MCRTAWAANRGALNWRTVGLHDRRRRQLQLDARADRPALGGACAYSGCGNTVALRFRISSGTGGNPVRWYIDDLEIVDEPTPAPTFTIGDEWDMNSAAQMDDFIFDGDSTG